jgi:hypothetical protein
MLSLFGKSRHWQCDAIGLQRLRNQAVDLRNARRYCRKCAGISRPLGCAPDRGWKVAVPVEAGDDMPMKMRHQITERGQIDFFRLELGAQDFFDFGDRIHAGFPTGRRKVRKLGYMRVPYDPVIRRKTRIARLNHTQLRTPENQHPAVCLAKRTTAGRRVSCTQTSTRSIPPRFAACT